MSTPTPGAHDVAGRFFEHLDQRASIAIPFLLLLCGEHPGSARQLSILPDPANRKPEDRIKPMDRLQGRSSTLAQRSPPHAEVKANRSNRRPRQQEHRHRAPCHPQHQLPRESDITSCRGGRRFGGTFLRRGRGSRTRSHHHLRMIRKPGPQPFPANSRTGGITL